jgi:hypothetical protein
MQLSLFNDDRSPPVSRTERNDVRTGDAAEAFVIAKLLKWGYDAHNARRDSPYDVGVDLRDGRICRVQVKGCGKAVHGRWNYRLVRGNPRTGSGSYAYSDTDFDVTACVALSLERVIFFPGVHSTIRLTTADFRRSDGEAQSWERALQVFMRKH